MGADTPAVGGETKPIIKNNDKPNNNRQHGRRGNNNFQWRGDYVKKDKFVGADPNLTGFTFVSKTFRSSGQLWDSRRHHPESKRRRVHTTISQPTTNNIKTHQRWKLPSLYFHCHSVNSSSSPWWYWISLAGHLAISIEVRLLAISTQYVNPQTRH